MKKLLIENLSESMTLVQKAEFEAVNAVFDALDFAFHPNGFDEDPDERFLSLWRLFLVCSGWIESDYWAECEFRAANHKCPQCQEKEVLEESSIEGSDKISEKKSN
jgi:hypothetical protein